MLEIHPAIRGDWFLWKNLMSLVAKESLLIDKVRGQLSRFESELSNPNVLARKHQTFCRCIACVIPLSVTVPHLT